MSFKNYSILLSLIVAFAGCTSKPEPTDKKIAVEKGLKELIHIKGTPYQTHTIEERMEYYKVPGVSIAVIEGGKIDWAAGYGLANAPRGTYVDTQTLFQAGSISKPLAALGALQLVDQGIWKLDEDVNQWLKDWKIPESSFTETEKVSLRRLLTHTGGLTVHGFPGYETSLPIPDTKAVLEGRGNTPPIFVDTIPGAIWRYSGGGYTVMQKMIEDQTGIAFEDFIDSIVLQPLGMQNSTYANPLPEKLHSRASAAYDRSGDIVPGGDWHNYPEKAAAGLWTTPRDLANYLISVQKTVAGAPHPVLSRDMILNMLTPDQNNWGLGPALNGEGALQTFGHGGKNEGFTNHMTAFIHEGRGVVVMTNADRGLGLIREILRAVSEVYGWPDQKSPTEKVIADMNPKQQQAIVGSYHSSIEGKTKVITIELRSDNSYHLYAEGVMDVIAWADSDSTLFTLSEENILKFEKSKGGNTDGGKLFGFYQFSRVSE